MSNEGTAMTPWTVELLQRQLNIDRAGGWWPVTLRVRADELEELRPIAAACGLAIEIRSWPDIELGQVTFIFANPWDTKRGPDGKTAVGIRDNE